MIRNLFRKEYLIPLVVAVFAMALNGAAQPTEQQQEMINRGADSLAYMLLFVVIVSLAIGAFLWFRYNRSNMPTPSAEYHARVATYSSSESFDVQADEDIEWLRQVKRSSGNGNGNTKGNVNGSVSAPKMVYRQPPTIAPKRPAAKEEDDSLDTKIFQEKMRRMQYTQLPINSFSQLAPARTYQPLPESDDSSLLTAIEQTNEEFEEDEAVREVALRILTAFRTRNSVDALSQIALYDLSSNLRARAVSTLADFDHESVFETILLACADPTREVRAAAARALFRLGFDRAHAWKRLIQTGDEYRMTQAARAAIEAGIVVKSLDRLINEDVKVAYEAFALVSLLISAGETSEVFDAIENHRDERVKFALLHVIKINQDPRTLTKLNELRVRSSFPTDMADRIREVVTSFVEVRA